MFVVALAELAGDLETEAGPLAAELGVAPYDVKARFAGVLPRVVFQSMDQAEVSRVLAIVRARGHRAFLADTRDVPPSGGLVRLHRFALEEASLLANDGGPRLAYADIGAILVTTFRTDVVRESDEVDMVPVGRYGESVPVHVNHTRHERLYEHAAYIYPRSAPDQPLSRPWLFHEREARYMSLGTAMRPTRYENFVAALALLEQRAPDAIYDDRFSVARLDSSQLLHVRGHDSAAARLTDAHCDLAVHLLATWLLGDRTEPYR